MGSDCPRPHRKIDNTIASVYTAVLNQWYSLIYCGSQRPIFGWPFPFPRREFAILEIFAQNNLTVLVSLSSCGSTFQRNPRPPLDDHLERMCLSPHVFVYLCLQEIKIFNQYVKQQVFQTGLYPMNDFYQLIQRRSSSDKTIYQ